MTADPCTDEAIDDGCTCTMGYAHSASIDPPEAIIDPWCPLHGGRDPDREREQARDEAADERRGDQHDEF